MDPREKIMEAFRRSGFRATAQRIAIAQVVLSSKDHPTAEQVFEVVRITNPTISLSTVYNTLNTMKEMNMIHELAFNNNHRFDPNIKIHINLVCQNCGEIIDVDNEIIEKEIKTVSKKRGFKITGHRIDIYGTCRKCLTTLKI